MANKTKKKSPIAADAASKAAADALSHKSDVQCVTKGELLEFAKRIELAVADPVKLA